MPLNSNLTYSHQTAHQRLSRRSVASPYSPIGSPTSPLATPPQPQGPPICDLFATLLFNRQKAYQSRSCVLPAPPSALFAEAEKITSTKRHTEVQIQHTPPISSKPHVHKEEEAYALQGHIPLPGNWKPAMLSKTPTVNRKRDRPAKQTPTKDAGKTTTEKPRKRAAPARVLPRAAKRQKPEANTKQKLNHTGSMGHSMTTALTTKSDKDIEIITISDSEDEGYQPTRRGGIGHKEGEDAGFGASKINIHEDDDVKPDIPTLAANPEPFQLASTRSPFVPLDQAPRWAFSGPDASESESDLHPGPSRNDLQNDMARAEAEHTKEKKQLSLELDAAKAELEKVKRLHEKEKGDSELMQVRSSNITRQEMQRLQNELETERISLRAAVRERDQLRIDIDNSIARNNQLARELQDEKKLRDNERKEHESILEDVMKSKEPTSDSANDFLVTENGRLRTENENLRAAAAAAATRGPPMPQSSFPLPPSSIFTPPSSQLSQQCPYPSIFAAEPAQPSQLLSPAPSSVTSYAPTTTEERKEENIRKTYIRVKRRFDNLHAAAGNLTNCTRGMDLSSFGQFGQYLRQLKRALDEDAKKSVEKKEDEDAK